MVEVREIPKNEKAQGILNENWRNFLKWQAETQAGKALSIPQNIANVFIPKKILEIANNPSSVHVFTAMHPPVNNWEEGIRILIFEKTSKPLTNPDVFRKWSENNFKNPNSIRKIPQSQEESQPGIDYKHDQYNQLIRDNTLNFNDRILIDYSARVPAGYPDIVVTMQYLDRRELQGMGIGTSFYERAGDIFTQLGFKYLAGDIESKHPSFFHKNRKRYGDFGEKGKELFPQVFSEGNYMIQTL